MIGRLQGLLLEKLDGEVVLDVQGVGYEVEVPTSTLWQLPECGHTTVLYTHFVVREDAQLLYGFCEQKDRTLFRLLIKVNGVGPKMALAILSGMTSGQLVSCVAANDLNALVKVPGVGKKTAERLIIEMRDKLKGWQTDSAIAGQSSVPEVTNQSIDLRDAEAALISLGYKPQEAARAAMGAIAVLEKSNSSADTAAIIRTALQNLGKNSGS